MHNGNCVALWRAVIHQALIDLVYSRAQESSAAYRWLFSSNSGFKTVCQMADLNVDYVRKEARRRLESPVSKLSVVLGKKRGFNRSTK